MVHCFPLSLGKIIISPSSDLFCKLSNPSFCSCVMLLYFTLPFLLQFFFLNSFITLSYISFLACNSNSSAVGLSSARCVLLFSFISVALCFVKSTLLFFRSKISLCTASSSALSINLSLSSFFSCSSFSLYPFSCLSHLALHSASSISPAINASSMSSYVV